VLLSFYQNRSNNQYYPIRGGATDRKVQCGAFCNYFDNRSTGASMVIGAALVYQNRSGPNYIRRGGGSYSGTYDGIFSIVASDNIGSYYHWSIGAALSFKVMY